MGGGGDASGSGRSNDAKLTSSGARLAGLLAVVVVVADGHARVGRREVEGRGGDHGHLGVAGRACRGPHYSTGWVGGVLRVGLGRQDGEVWRGCRVRPV